MSSAVGAARGDAGHGQPRISICIPTYNRAGLISRTLSQALAQTDTDVEVILVDDASTDETEEIVARFADPRLRVEKTGRHLGQGVVFNHSWDLARGTYVKIFCDDDFLYPGAVSRLADALDRFPSATFATSAWNLVDGAGAIMKTLRVLQTAPEDGELVDLRRIVRMSWLSFNRIGSPSAVLLRRAALSGLRFNPDYKQMMDWDLWLHLLARGPLVYLPAVLSGYQWHDETLSVKQRPVAQTATDLLMISRELTASLAEWCGISRFDVKRLQLLCLANILVVLLQNVAGRRWQFVGGNIDSALSVAHTFLTDW